MVGDVYAENLIIGGGGDQVFTTPNASLVAVSSGNRTLPNGKVIDLTVGQFALGADQQTQLFSSGTDDKNDPGIVTWNMPGYLYNSSATKSNSYAIHVGSTRYDYPGSLIFGGYDKGRVIGPATTWGDSPPQLLDIVIGVEIGGSPFDFDSKTGLLLTNTSTNTQLPVFPEPLEPYLHLPKQTCNNLAKYLPIKFDTSSGFYLWDRTDPSYANITNAAAYLGFVFPPGPGSTEDVTIKVPFQLLVLNLTSEASGQPGLTPYFPCMPYTPPGSGPGAGGSGSNSYLLGRAFLQAAFVGRNMNQHVSWLAQAPGPGASKEGLGYQPQDIQDTDTTLDLYVGDQYFNSSWSAYWKPLPGKVTSTPDGTSNSEGTGSGTGGSLDTSVTKSSSLSTGAKAGIGIGAAAVGVGLLAVAAFFFTRRRRARGDKNSEDLPFVGNEPTQQGAQAHYSDDPKHDTSQPVEMTGEYYAPRKSGLPAQHQPIPLSELPSRDRQEALELPGNHDPVELGPGDANKASRNPSNSSRLSELP